MDWGNVIFVLFVIVAVFLILREFWCWYWKVNRLIALLEEQNQLLKDMAARNNIHQNQTRVVN
jgi:hypothetical protein